MSDLASLPPTFVATRGALHRVAAHVLAPARAKVTGKFGLRVMPGGFGTPAFGDEHEVLRVTRHGLTRERTGSGGASTIVMPLVASSLSALAALAEVDLDANFSVGHETPAQGDIDALLPIEASAMAALAVWYGLGAAVLDEVVARLAPEAAPTVAQLWPEHFDVGLDVGVDGERRTNLGASPGDRASPEPYLYVGPWGDERPGDPTYWNAAFGAIVGYEQLLAAPDPVVAGVDFLRRGLQLLESG
jgi:hypothetical protein